MIALARSSWRTAALLVLVGLGGSACASAPPIGARPLPFPGSPPQTWADHRSPQIEAVTTDIVATALALRGARYQLGGSTPQAGFDCSGFVRYVFAQASLDMPRTVAEQFHVGREVARSHVSSGDLVFFSTTGPGATHVGIVVDPDARTFVHAPGTGANVRVERFDSPYWKRRMLGARRLALTIPPAS